MPAYNIIILAAMILFGTVMLTGFLMALVRKKSFFGKPTIDKYFFFSGKLAMFLTWGLLIMKAADPRFGEIKLPIALNWCVTALVCLGIIITLVSIAALGNSVRVGLPEEQTALRTNGIYRFSRNPLYVGVILITIASGIYLPETGNIGLALYAIGVHHAIIINEEKFLEQKFGEEYKAYRKKVRRYI